MFIIKNNNFILMKLRLKILQINSWWMIPLKEEVVSSFEKRKKQLEMLLNYIEFVNLLNKINIYYYFFRN